MNSLNFIACFFLEKVWEFISYMRLEGAETFDVMFSIVILLYQQVKWSMLGIVDLWKMPFIITVLKTLWLKCHERLNSIVGFSGLFMINRQLLSKLLFFIKYLKSTFLEFLNFLIDFNLQKYHKKKTVIETGINKTTYEALLFFKFHVLWYPLQYVYIPLVACY